MDVKVFAESLAHAESEEEVIEILDSHHLWDNPENWVPYGGNENNYSIIGNQQSAPDAALVEKIVNSIDATLMKECQLQGISPKGDDAPKSIEEAIKLFYKVPEGVFQNLSSSERNKFANSIVLAASGEKKKINFTIVDKGEGQTPKMVPETILSLNKGNKISVHFVQGKFNMGGTGVLNFSGSNSDSHSINVIISRRCPEIVDSSDPTSHLWSVTVVRKEKPGKNRKSSMFTYLVDKDNKLFSFEVDSLPIIPNEYGKEKTSMEYGTFIKMFDYAIKPKTNVLFDINNRLALLLPRLAHPIRLVESRNYQGKTLIATLNGIETRLRDNSALLEKGFPLSSEFMVDGQPFIVTIYLFKPTKENSSKRASEKFRNKEGVLYTVNGQTHYIENDTFFTTKKVGLSYLQDSLLVIVDCSRINAAHNEDLFMTSRDRMKDSSFAKNVKAKLQDILKDNDGLKKAQQQRRELMVKDKLNDKAPLKDTLEKILKSSPVLSKVLFGEGRLNNPFHSSPKGSHENSDFKGRYFPDYFQLEKKFTKGPKQVPAKQTSFRVSFQTDAMNDYFSRANEPVQFNLQIERDGRWECVENRHLNLCDGIATLNINPPENCKEGDKYLYRAIVDDTSRSIPFENNFEICITKEQKQSSKGGKGKRRSGSDLPGGTNDSRGVALPNIIEVYQEQWEDYGMTPESAVILRSDGESRDLFLNMNNLYLMTELNVTRDQSKMDLLKAQFQYANALLAIAIEGFYEKQEGPEINIEDQVKVLTEALSPVLLPMIRTLGSIDDLEKE